MIDHGWSVSCCADQGFLIIDVHQRLIISVETQVIDYDVSHAGIIYTELYILVINKSPGAILLPQVQHETLIKDSIQTVFASNLAINVSLNGQDCR